MSAQEVLHLILQSGDITHNLEFVRTSMQCTDVEWITAGTGKLAAGLGVFHVYASGMEKNAWHERRPDYSQP